MDKPDEARKLFAMVHKAVAYVLTGSPERATQAGQVANLIAKEIALARLNLVQPISKGNTFSKSRLRQKKRTFDVLWESVAAPSLGFQV